MSGLTGEIMLIQENERRIISRELHDNTGQKLVILQESLGISLSNLPEEFTTIKNRLAGDLILIDQVSNQIRSVSHKLRPPILEVGGIHVSLDELCRECSEQTSVNFHYQGEHVQGLPDNIGITLYRVAQEAVANILKHSQANEVSVKLRYRKGLIFLSISDNGVGDSMASDHTGIGLIGLRERLNLLGGRLKIYSRTGQGFLLKALIPWQQVTT